MLNQRVIYSSFHISFGSVFIFLQVVFKLDVIIHCSIKPRFFSKVVMHFGEKSEFWTENWLPDYMHCFQVNYYPTLPSLPFSVILGAANVTGNTPCELHHCTQPVHCLPHPPHAAAEVRTACYNNLVNISCVENLSALFSGHLIVNCKPKVHDGIIYNKNDVIIFTDYSSQVWRQALIL